MVTLKPVPLLAASLALAACAHQAPRPGIPARADLERALMPLDLCAGDDSGSCDSFGMPKRIQLVASRCARLPSREGKRVAACRVTFREIHYVPELNRTFAGGCVELVADPPSPGEPLFWSRDWGRLWRERADTDEPCRRVGL